MKIINKLKILQINPYPPEHLGGSELFSKNLAINLKIKKNINSDILTSDIFRRNIKTDFLNNSINIIYKKNLYNIWGKNPLVNVYSFLKKEIDNYDLVHAHSYIFFTSFQCALFRKMKKFPFILHIHGGVQTPKILSLSLLENIQLNFKNRIFDNSFGRITIKNADALISVSKIDLDFIIKKYKLQHDNNFYIPNGVDTKIFHKNNQIEKKYVTFIGRLTYIKGFDKFIDCIKNLYKIDKNLEFLIIGRGPLIKLIRSVQKTLPITHYEYFPHDKMVDIYNQSKLILITSRFEGVPTIILESLACETPIIAVNVGGISEVIRNDENGLLLNNFNSNSTISRILAFLHDESKLKTFGKKGRDLILSRFSWDIITDKIEKVYRKFLTN